VSVEAISLVLNHSRSEGTARLVLIGIANHDGDGGSWPAIATLARYANVSERSVQRALRTLVELAEVEIHRNDGGTHKTRNDQRPNRYVITVRRGDGGVAPSDRDGVTPPAPRGDTAVADGVTPLSPEPSYEPSREPSTPHSPPAQPVSSAQLTALEEEFAGFWKLYPRHVAKADALKAYRRARKDTPVETIAAGLRAQLPDLQSRTLDKVPHPTTWLNQRRWEDDPLHVSHQATAKHRGDLERSADGSLAGVVTGGQW
jgi:hypothetical protein